MYDIPIENHDQVPVMSAAYARDVMRVHECCATIACAKKRQAITRLVQARAADAAARPRK